MKKDWFRFSAPRSMPPAQAYNLWAATYDNQPNNLMLKLDLEIFTKFLAAADIERKTVADVGCGTGRHWKEILARQPKRLTGLDVSPEMLAQLKQKFPEA